MCGFAAVVDTAMPSEEARSLVHTMLATMAHRGPDATAVLQKNHCTLGHNRLSIIDVSEASNQPFEAFNIIVVFNGEIYNYIELRSELEGKGLRFRTTGDTEVLCAAFRVWGMQCVEKFVGMWAFVAIDSETGDVFCSRDRFGIKPFVYAKQGNRIHMASEIKAMRRSPLVGSGINGNQVIRGLYLGFMQHWDETYFNDVHILPAGHNMLVTATNIRIWQYAQVPTSIIEQPFEQDVSEFRSLFLDALRITSRRDVPMGVCLSGGLDSTSIVCALEHSGTEHATKTFTAFYTGKNQVDERPYIQHVLHAYPDVLNATIEPTDSDVAEHFHDIVAMMDAPMPSSSYISQYFVMKLAASQGVKVVLDGQGSDEILGGYMHSMYRSIADCVQRGNVGAALQEWHSHGNRQGYGCTKRMSVFAKSLLTLFKTEEQLYMLEQLRGSPWITNASGAPLRAAQPMANKLTTFLKYLVDISLLPTLLHTEDINSMAHSIESRVPFLDHRLVHRAFQMPNRSKTARGETKRVLRAAMRGIVPDAVLDRKDKTGFITPGHIAWLRGELRGYTEGRWSEVEEFIPGSNLKPILDEYHNGNNNHALFVWRLTMLRVFLRHVGA
jgi:asparagine synthase (glutamine-hydrolysing)